MTSPWATLLPLAWLSLRDPREAASAVLSIGVPRQAILPAGLLVVVLSVILTVVADMLLPGAPQADGSVAEARIFSPMGLFALLGGTLLAYIYGVFLVGRAMGGRGSLLEAALLMVLLQFVVLTSQVAEVAIILLVPSLAGMFAIAVAVIALWINVNFVSVLHGFSVWKSLGAILLVSLALGFGALLLLSITGAGVETAA